MGNFNPAISDRLASAGESILKGHYTFEDHNSDAYLQARFSKPVELPRNIHIELLSNSKHRQQYYKIREDAYRQVLGERDFDGSQDYFDGISEAHVVLASNNCVGGMRLTISKPGNYQPMPMETDQFHLNELYPFLVTEGVTYCEPSRLALLPEFRTGKTYYELQAKSTEYFIQKHNGQIAFGRSPAVQTKRFGELFAKMGYKLIIREDVHVPHTESNKHLNMQFWAVDFTKDAKFTELLIKSNREITLPAKDKELA